MGAEEGVSDAGPDDDSALSPTAAERAGEEEFAFEGWLVEESRDRDGVVEEVEAEVEEVGGIRSRQKTARVWPSI